MNPENKGGMEEEGGGRTLQRTAATERPQELLRKQLPSHRPGWFSPVGNWLSLACTNEHRFAVIALFYQLNPCTFVGKQCFSSFVINQTLEGFLKHSLLSPTSRDCDVVGLR